MTILFCALFAINTFAANAVTGDTLITCNIDGTLTDKGTTINSATITVSNIDTSGNYIYSGILLGVFKKGVSDWSLVPELSQSILTNSTVVQLTSFGDIIKYEYSSIYALGYRILYEPIGSNQLIEGTDWIPINDNFFKVMSGAPSATITGTSITPTGTNDVNITGTGTNIAAAKYRVFYTTSDILPSLDRTPNVENPGNGWTDSGSVYDMTIISPTSVSATALGTTFNATWKYVLFKVAVTSMTDESDGWVWKYTDAYKIATKEVVVPPQQSAGPVTISTVTVMPPQIPQGETGYGKPVDLSATGTNISNAKYRIFFTKNATPPTILTTDNAPDPDTNADSGWEQPNPQYVADMTINSSTSVSATVPGSDFDDTNYKYAIFKVAVADTDNNWTWKYSSIYKISDWQVSTPTTPPSPPSTSNYGYLSYVAHNQLVDTDGKRLIATGPHTLDSKYGPYTYSDLLALDNYNKFYNGNTVTYRLEFDILTPEKANEIKDMKIDFDFNSTNEKNVDLQPLSVNLLKRQTNGTFALAKVLSFAPDGTNRYYTAIGLSDAKNPMFAEGGIGRYAIEYTMVVNVGPDPEDSMVTIKNDTQIKIYIGEYIYTEVIEPARPNHKFYIETKVSRQGV